MGTKPSRGVRKCKTCQGTSSWHDWKQKPYCSPFCRGDFKSRSFLIHKTAYANYNYGIKDESTLQPFMKDGTINKEFVQAHGTASLSKELKLSGRAIREQADKPTMTVAELRASQ